MSTEDEDKDDTNAEESQGEEEPKESPEVVRVGQDVEQGVVVSQLGATRYVLAGFFAAGIAVAYVLSHAITAGWSKIADSQFGVDKFPWLTRTAEDERGTYATIFAAFVGLGAVIYTYRRADIRNWVYEAAAELAKVTWPTKKDVTNATVVVVVASVVATVYLALLDRFWGFVTNLVYGV